jgi:hypothetical protein
MHRATLITGILLSLVVTNQCIAEWGWPPPGYSVTGVRCSDGYRYRGLCQVWRDRRSSRCQNCNSGQPVQPPVMNGDQHETRPSEPAPETLPPPRR